MDNPTDALLLLAEAVADAAPAGQLRELRDDDLLIVASAIETLGRRVDALRVEAAAELEDRSRSGLGSESLAAKKGCRNTIELLQRVTLCSAVTVARRVAVGRETRQQDALSGALLPARFAHVAQSLAQGQIGVDSAAAIVRALASCGDRAAIDDLNAAEIALVASATGIDASAGSKTASGRDSDSDSAAHVPCAADEVRLQALVWQAVLDPDGVENAEERAMARRGVRIGRERDGLIPLTGSLMPEIAAKLQRLFDAYLSPKTGPVFLVEPKPIDANEKDQRSADQRRHDGLAGIVDAASRGSDAPLLGGAAPTVLVSVRAEDLAESLVAGNASGVGFVDGLDVPIAMPAVKQFACNGGIQPVVFGPGGDIQQLGSPQRCFTPQQRRAILLRDGGCAIAGCSAPGSWCEIHHVVPDAQNGETHTSNGVALCWFHHRTIDTSGWQIRMTNGAPQLKAPPWIERDGPWRSARKSPLHAIEAAHNIRKKRKDTRQ